MNILWLPCGTISCYPSYTSVSPQLAFFSILRPFEACFCYYDIIQVVLGWECNHSCPLYQSIKVHLTVQSRFYLNRVPNWFRRGREELIAHEQMMSVWRDLSWVHFLIRGYGEEVAALEASRLWIGSVMGLIFSRWRVSAVDLASWSRSRILSAVSKQETTMWILAVASEHFPRS